ncbi:MAG: TolB family protein [Thermoplasmata archaeon]
MIVGIYYGSSSSDSQENVIMNSIWKRVSSVGLVVAFLATLLMSFPLISAAPPDKCEPWPECKDGEEPPADPAIAFCQSNRIWVMNDDGSNQAVVFEGYFGYNSLSWSPDAKSLAWSGYKYVPNVPGYDHGVWRIDVNVVDGEPQGSNLQRLVTPPGEDHYIGGAAWSPLGDEIAYMVRISDTESGIDAVPATGGTPYRIYTSPDGFGVLAGSDVTWRSDGSRLAFISVEISVARSIMIIDRATGTVTHSLLTGQFHFSGLDWAQGVDSLIFDDGNSGMIYTVDIGTETAEPVVTGSLPSWSPDNSKIVYQQQLNRRKHKISTYEFSTGDITPLAKGPARSDWRRF